MKKFFNEFKEFIAKGNALTMAVGVVVGGAFTAIVNSLVGDVISPVIGLITGGVDFSQVSFGIGDAQIMIGNFINAVISFILTALVLFIVIRAFNKFDEMNKKLLKKEEEKKEEPATPVPTELDVLNEIRDLLKENK